jgi:hypothetical protein
MIDPSSLEPGVNWFGAHATMTRRTLQTKFGAEGDCFNACVSSILDIPLEQIDYYRSDDTWYADFQNWLAPRGLAYVEIGNVMPTPFYRFPLPVLAIGGGPSPRGVEGGHACVIELRGWQKVVVHDPHPSGAGIEEIKTVGLFVRVRSD